MNKIDANSDLHVTGRLGYVQRPRQRLFNYMYAPPDGTPWHNCAYRPHDCRIRNARRLASSLSLQQNGFELHHAPSAVADFYDGQQVISIYYREIEAMAKALTGGMHAHVFDHQLRRLDTDRPISLFGREGGGSEPAAVGCVHNDYSDASGRRRKQLALPECAPDQPFMILNFWRPVLHAALDAPLAVCDARSFGAGDWAVCDLFYPARVGEICLGLHAETHDWYYYPAMTPDELLVFVTYDSRIDSPVRMTPHCAFDDPTAPAGAPRRRSIEARCIVILD